VRNVQVLVKPNQDGSIKYKPSQGYQLKRHVSKLLVLVPAEEQDDVEVEKDILENDVEMEKNILDDDVEVENGIMDDDVCDSMAQSVGSSYNSPDVQQQEEVAAEGEVYEEPGGTVAPSRRSPRFGHTNA
jgi:hypothetical protein